jgi:hypothetical protein
MVTLKIRFPTINILILKKKINVTQNTASKLPVVSGTATDPKVEALVVDADKARAADLATSSSNLNMFSNNPVFLARIHLRNLELDKVKQLLFDFNLKGEDIIFIRTFLEVMLKNVNDKEELRLNREKVKILDEIFRLSTMIVNQDEMEFEKELEKGLSKDVAYMIYALLEKYQEQSKNIEEEIMLWEWKYRARRLM